METDFDSSIPRDMAWGAVMRPVPLPDINEMNKKTIMTTTIIENKMSDFPFRVYAVKRMEPKENE